MSVRAYRIISIKRAESPTLNCWHDGELLDFLLGDGGWRTDNGDGISQFEVSVERLEKAIKAIKKGEFDADYKEYKDAEAEKDDLIKSLKKDIAWAKKKGDDYIMYDCY